jgi:hypothetical protein
VRPQASETAKPSPNEAWSLDVAIAPDAAVGRISANINRRGKRAFGVLKTANEYIGVVAQRDFEIWERQKRAIHARGRVVARSRGSRIEVAFVVAAWTRLLLGLFFLLYALVTVGIATQPPDPSVSIGEVVIAIAGVALLVTLFVIGARSQQADLRGFLERIFEDVAKI